MNPHSEVSSTTSAVNPAITNQEMKMNAASVTPYNEDTIVAGRPIESLPSGDNNSFSSCNLTPPPQQKVEVDKIAKSQADAKYWKKVSLVSLVLLPIICSLLTLAMVVAGNALSPQETKYVNDSANQDAYGSARGLTTEYRVNGGDMDNALIETGLVSSFSGLTNLPKQSRRFLNSMNKITYVDPDSGSVISAMVKRHEWKNCRSMLIYIEGGEKVRIYGKDVRVERDNGTKVVELMFKNSSTGLLRKLEEDSTSLVYSKSDLENLYQKHLKSLGRELSNSHSHESDEAIVELARGLGGIIESNIDSNTANKSGANHQCDMSKIHETDYNNNAGVTSTNVKKGAVEVQPLQIPASSKWTLSGLANPIADSNTNQPSTNAFWYFHYNPQTKQMKSRADYFDSGVTKFVQEFHYVDHDSDENTPIKVTSYSYQQPDSDMTIKQLETNQANDDDCKDIPVTEMGTTCDIFKGMMANEIKSMVLRQEKEECVITEDVQTFSSKHANGKSSKPTASGARLVKVLYPSDTDHHKNLSVKPTGAIWSLAGLLIEATVDGKPLKLLDDDDGDFVSTKVIATVQSIVPMVEQNILTHFKGCVKDSNRRELEDDLDEEEDLDSKLSKEQLKAKQIIAYLKTGMNPIDKSKNYSPVKRNLDLWGDFQKWSSKTNWCGSGTNKETTACPKNKTDKACFRHDHNKKYKSVWWTFNGAMRTTCYADKDLYDDRDGSWYISAIYGKYGLSGGWGCYNYERYGCWKRSGWRMRYRTCTGDVVRSGSRRYSTRLSWNTGNYKYNDVKGKAKTDNCDGPDGPSGWPRNGN